MTVLIPWRQVARRWSLWLVAAGGALLGFFTWFPAQALALWQSLPPEFTAHVPKIAGMDIGLILIVLAKIAMFIDQDAVKTRFAMLKNWIVNMAQAGGGGVKPAHAAAGGIAAALALAIPLIMSFEGYSAKPYQDVVGIMTVCYGHTGDVQARSYTEAQCRDLLKTDAGRHALSVYTCTPAVIDHPYAFAAFTSFDFNTGRYCGSTMAKLAAAGNYPDACAQLDRWVYAGGKRFYGLVRRRAAERKLCEEGMQ